MTDFTVKYGVKIFLKYFSGKILYFLSKLIAIYKWGETDLIISIVDGNKSRKSLILMQFNSEQADLGHLS